MTAATFRQAHGSKPRRVVQITDDATVVDLARQFNLDPEHVADVHVVGPHYVFRVWSCTADGAERYEAGVRVWHHVYHPTRKATA